MDTVAEVVETRGEARCRAGGRAIGAGGEDGGAVGPAAQGWFSWSSPERLAFSACSWICVEI
jgi:hypothetical protein